jgi:hypothetical protein
MLPLYRERCGRILGGGNALKESDFLSAMALDGLLDKYGLLEGRVSDGGNVPHPILLGVWILLAHGARPGYLL